MVNESIAPGHFAVAGPATLTLAILLGAVESAEPVAADDRALDWQLVARLDASGAGQVVLNDQTLALQGWQDLEATRRAVRRRLKELFPGSDTLEGQLVVNGVELPVRRSKLVETQRWLDDKLERIQRIAATRSVSAPGGVGLDRKVTVQGIETPLPLLETLLRWQRESPASSTDAPPLLAQPLDEVALAAQLKSCDTVELFRNDAHRESWLKPLRQRQALPLAAAMSALRAMTTRIDASLGGLGVSPDLERRPPRVEPLRDELPRRTDLAGLPILDAATSALKDSELTLLKALAQHPLTLAHKASGVFGAGKSERGASAADSSLRLVLQQLPWLESPDGVPALEQVCQASGVDGRLALVEMLAKIDDESATRALARRALFDLSPVVRLAAIGRLRSRVEDARPELLRGLRYPWPPVAGHAAEALAQLDDRAAVPELIEQLELPDPRGPVSTEDGRTVARDLMRIHHQRNCLLCHAPSVDADDGFTSAVPDPARPGASAYSSGSDPASLPPAVRVDVTYLRQDFSVTQGTERHDYVIRERPLTKTAATAMRRNLEAGSSPYDAAVLFALRRLTGRDAGTSTDAWRRTLTD